jgi:hypothetical protein
MGKITGFLEFERLAEASEAVEARNRRAGEAAGRALHGLRHAVLHVGLSGEQHHSGLE